MNNFIDNIANVVPLPEEVAGQDASSLRGGSHVPPVLVVQIHVPNEQTSVLQQMQMLPMQRKREVAGVSVVVYFSLTAVSGGSL